MLFYSDRVSNVFLFFSFFYKSTLLFAVFGILCVIFSKFQALISLTQPPCFIFLFNCFGHWFKHRLSCPQESYLLLSITLSILCIMLISCASVKLCRQATNLFILLNYVVFFSFSIQVSITDQKEQFMS